MQHFKRRSFLKSLGVSSLSMALMQFALSKPSLGAERSVDDWLDELYANSKKLRSRENSGLQWQEVMDQIYGSVPLTKLKDRLEFPALSKQILEDIPSDRHEFFHRVELPGSSQPANAEGREPHRVLITKVAHVRKGHSVPPHGHSNMVSAFLCLSGEFDVKLYDRLEDRENDMVLRQTRDDKSAGAGTWSSISDYRDNVHWLTAKTDDCFLFSCKLINLEEDRELKGRINVDLKQARTLGTNTFQAPKITAAEARELY